MRRRRTVCTGCIGESLRCQELGQANPKAVAEAGGMARQGMDRGWGWLGFWRFVIGERSRKHAIARLGPRRPALAVVLGWLTQVRAWFGPARRGAVSGRTQWPRRPVPARGRCATLRRP